MARCLVASPKTPLLCGTDPLAPKPCKGSAEQCGRVSRSSHRAHLGQRRVQPQFQLRAPERLLAERDLQAHPVLHAPARAAARGQRGAHQRVRQAAHAAQPGLQLGLQRDQTLRRRRRPAPGVGCTTCVQPRTTAHCADRLRLSGPARAEDAAVAHACLSAASQRRASTSCREGVHWRITCCKRAAAGWCPAHAILQKTIRRIQGRPGRASHLGAGHPRFRRGRSRVGLELLVPVARALLALGRAVRGVRLVICEPDAVFGSSTLMTQSLKLQHADDSVTSVTKATASEQVQPQGKTAMRGKRVAAPITWGRSHCRVRVGDGRQIGVQQRHHLHQIQGIRYACTALLCQPRCRCLSDR